jgi:hypothetical protein
MNSPFNTELITSAEDMIGCVTMGFASFINLPLSTDGEKERDRKIAILQQWISIAHTISETPILFSAEDEKRKPNLVESMILIIASVVSSKMYNTDKKLLGLLLTTEGIVDYLAIATSIFSMCDYDYYWDNRHLFNSTTLGYFIQHRYRNESINALDEKLMELKLSIPTLD